jgi:hypothetical protein
MRIRSAIIVCAAAITAFSSCDKYSQIDSSNTIKHPYVVHAGGLLGMVARTNNAQVYDYIFQDDKSYSKGICTYEKNIFHFRNHIYRADGSKPNYAPIKQGNFFTINRVLLNNDNGHCLNPYVVDSIHGDVYVCTNSGLVLSGKKGTDPFIVDPAPGSMALTTSIVQLSNGSLYAFNCQGTPRFFKRDQPTPITNGVQAWQTLPDPGALTSGNNEYWMLASQGSRLWAVEKRGNVFPHFSNDGGTTWSAVPGLPDSVVITMAKGTNLNKGFFVACDSLGVYRYDQGNNKFEFSSGNLPKYIRVFDITSKRNIYRSDKSKDFYFIATNMGLYMSDNDGYDWNKVNDFPFSALW